MDKVFVTGLVKVSRSMGIREVDEEGFIRIIFWEVVIFWILWRRLTIGSVVEVNMKKVMTEAGVIISRIEGNWRENWLVLRRDVIVEGDIFLIIYVKAVEVLLAGLLVIWRRGIEGLIRRVIEVGLMVIKVQGSFVVTVLGDGLINRN